MPDQVEYYNHFGELYKADILNCPQPELWTTDYKQGGRIYEEMLARIKKQSALIEEFFSRQFPVLDAGCGFGRQSIILAKRGFPVVGFDSSEVFIEIAEEIFKQHHLKGRFFTGKIDALSLDPFFQSVLFDVLEHIRPPVRKSFLRKLHSLLRSEAILIISLPHLKKRLTSKANNSLRKAITQHFGYFLSREEHPYPIPTSKEMYNLINGLFKVLRFEETAATDYYVLRRI